MKLLLIRHPKPDVAKGLCYGQTDVPIVESWSHDAQAINTWLSKHYPDKTWQFFHSPLVRTRLLAQTLHPQSVSVEAIKEVDFGNWENRLWNDIPKSEIDEWMACLTNNAPYHGESLTALLERVISWFEGIRQADKDTVLVTHAGVIKVLVAHLCQWPLDQCHRLTPSYSSITELDLGEHYAMLNRLGAGDWVR